MEAEARQGVKEILDAYGSATSRAQARSIARRATQLREAYGDWRVRQLFEAAGKNRLLNICIEKALEAHEADRAGLVKLHLCFAIDNLPDEDDVRMEFSYALPDASASYFVKKRRWPVKLPAAPATAAR